LEIGALMRKAEDELSRLGSLADHYLLCCRNGATVGEVITRVRRLVAVGQETLGALGDSPPDAIVRVDAGLSPTMRLYLEEPFLARGPASTPDDTSGLVRFEMTDEEVVQLEVQAIHDLAERSRGQITAFAVSRREIEETLHATVTEVEWKALSRTLRYKPQVVARFLSNIVSHYRAAKPTHL